MSAPPSVLEVLLLGLAALPGLVDSRVRMTPNGRLLDELAADRAPALLAGATSLGRHQVSSSVVAPAAPDLTESIADLQLSLAT